MRDESYPYRVMGHNPFFLITSSFWIVHDFFLCNPSTLFDFIMYVVRFMPGGPCFNNIDESCNIQSSTLFELLSPICAEEMAQKRGECNITTIFRNYNHHRKFRLVPEETVAMRWVLIQ